MGEILLKIIMGAFALIVTISLISFHPLDPYPFSQGIGASTHNLCGTFGAYIVGILQVSIGIASWLFPIYLLWECFGIKNSKCHQRLAWLTILISVCTILGAISYPRLWSLGNNQQPIELRWGGFAGCLLWPIVKQALGIVGSPVIIITSMYLALLVLAPNQTKSVSKVMLTWLSRIATPWLKSVVTSGIYKVANLFKKSNNSGDTNVDTEVKNTKAINVEEQEDNSKDKEQIAAFNRAENAFTSYVKANNKIKSESNITDVTNLTNPQQTNLTDLTNLQKTSNDCTKIENEQNSPIQNNTILPKTDIITMLDISKDISVVTKKIDILQNNNLIEHQPINLESNFNQNTYSQQTQKEIKNLPDKSDEVVFNAGLPPYTIFNQPKLEQNIDMTALELTRALLQEKFNEFKVKGTVTGLKPGPVVTVYEFQPDPGVPVAKVLNLEEDLALRLKAEKIRIDRIFGYNLVGIEVPNVNREIISFREIIESPEFISKAKNNSHGLLRLILGKSMSGQPVIVDLDKMPHLLIGGSTGSGKSVGVNAMICSILLRAMPNEVKLILIDPKMVELGIYEDIPHLWAPVVTDMKEAGRVLRWVVAQMEDRYKHLAMLNVRNLDSFNEKIVEAGGSIDISNRTPNPRWPDRPTLLEPLPYVVVVIDELADLMMVCRTEIEDSIARIAQKARAVGIHLILATQRPSVDIVTGVIKANLSSRLSYRVNTKIDSRTILDSSGGEQLLGKGDALFLAPGSARPMRIHAPLITEEETIHLVDWLKERGKPDYNKGLLSAIEVDDNEHNDVVETTTQADDNIYGRALAIVRRERKASTSLLQRRLSIGYGRAARIIDRMEEEGIISNDRGAGKPREVLIGDI